MQAVLLYAQLMYLHTQQATRNAPPCSHQEQHKYSIQIFDVDVGLSEIIQLDGPFNFLNSATTPAFTQHTAPNRTTPYTR